MKNEDSTEVDRKETADSNKSVDKMNHILYTTTEKE